MGMPLKKRIKIKKRLFGGRNLAPCCYCREALSIEEATIEHLKPKALGGKNNIENLAIACGPCNHSRGKALQMSLRSDLFTIIKECVKSCGMTFDEICELVVKIRSGQSKMIKSYNKNKKMHSVTHNGIEYFCLYLVSYGFPLQISINKS